MNRRTIGLGVIFLINSLTIALPGTPANAALLPVGGMQSPAVSESEPMNAIRLHGGTVRFNGSGISGTLTSTVWTNDPTNPFGADKLTFSYLLTNDTASSSGLSQLLVSNFTGTLTDVSYAPFDLVGGPVGAPPMFAQRPTADQIRFRFADVSIPEDPSSLLSAGSLSKLLVVQSDATEFSSMEAVVTASLTGNVVSVHSFAPLAAIPEPHTLLLAAIGSLALFGHLGRRKLRERV